MTAERRDLALRQTGRRRHGPRRRVVVTGRSRPEPDPGERDPARVVAFTDAVIAIAVTLLVLEIRPPQDTRHLLHGLAALWPSYVSYVVTFMLVGHGHRLLASTIDPAGVRAGSRRFQLALAWIGTGTVLGALLPALGVAVIAAFIVDYWLPISGELGRAGRPGPVESGALPTLTM